MSRLSRIALIVAAVAFPTAGLVAHVRLVHPSNGTPLRWSNPATVSIVINATGSDDIADGSHETSLRMAIQDWNAVTGTTATLVEDASDVSQTRTDWSSTGIHLIYFDETNESGFFPIGSSTVAITPVWFFSSGLIQDADVLFNGSGFHFTTAGQAGRFDVGAVGAHELGHLLGLDHSGAVGATLYPYVDTGLVLQRSLSQDDAHGLRDAYPQGTWGRISGTIVRESDSSTVAGAYVVARDAGGRTAASTLATNNGAFTLRGLDPDVYTVYARPLDNPVDAGNLGSGHAGAETDFEPAVYAATATITGGETLDLGELAVGDDVALNLGTAGDQFPARVVVGQSRTITLHGSGLFNGSTLTASDPDLILGLPTWFGSQVSFQVTVPAGEPRGHVDLTVTNSAGALSILPAALEVTPPSPTVTSVDPDAGPMQGGAALTISGTEFFAGARIVIADQIYTDGVNASVVDDTTITLTTAATPPGTHDVVVIDASGVEGRLVAAYTARSAPVIDGVLPVAGQASGGTEVVLAGDGFLDGLAVRIDGIDQGAVTVEPDGTEARFTTVGGVAGGPYTLELENPDGSLTTSSFSYAAQLDPSVAAILPDSGSTGGGTIVTITGANFTGATTVRFVGDPGAAPVDAASVTFVDPGTLEVVTPAHEQGTVGVLVEEPGGPGTFVEQAFTFSGGGGGGGCAIAPVPAPPRPRAVLEGAWWLFAVVLLLTANARRARAATARRTNR